MGGRVVHGLPGATLPSSRMTLTKQWCHLHHFEFTPNIEKKKFVMT